ncbi:MAG: hypothetical protein COZ06_24790 [Armatimonadetes bacterium CG_4_10_14_3_um_filter_66_18]|nr:MAG: hypothetical protein COZ57_07980 [Armatimonadetes bacterium CG_4_8_14_3_um_filter_66_20]PIY42640.1 MAG: hypothetical protein COZ06_24790 [Armatimonadetes bacterium CG_4_10_14_3_um_filter_66_18]
MITRCVLCGGLLSPTTRTFEYDWKRQQTVTIEDVPMHVCQDCGEAYMEPETSRALDEIAQPLLLGASGAEAQPLARLRFLSSPARERPLALVSA